MSIPFPVPFPTGRARFRMFLRLLLAGILTYTFVSGYRIYLDLTGTQEPVWVVNFVIVPMTAFLISFAMVHYATSKA